MTNPEFACWESTQGYCLENLGVIPDVELQILPQDLARGVDAQLDWAIAEIMRLHETHPPMLPQFGPVPGRSREDYRMRETPSGSQRPTAGGLPPRV